MDLPMAHSAEQHRSCPWREALPLHHSSCSIIFLEENSSISKGCSHENFSRHFLIKARPRRWCDYQVGALLLQWPGWIYPASKGSVQHGTGLNATLCVQPSSGCTCSGSLVCGSHESNVQQSLCQYKYAPMSIKCRTGKLCFSSHM